MRVLHIHDSDGEHRGAGSHIAMNRLHHGLNGIGIESTILCRTKTPTLQSSIEIPRSSVIRCTEGLLNRLALQLGLNEIAFINSFNIARLREFKAADVIHIHSIHGSYFSYLALSRLSRLKPVIFTMHDMWPYTGHCSISLDCERWKTGCGQCPYPNEYPKIKRDNTRLEWKLKNWTYSRSRLWIGTVSWAQTAIVQQSMLKRFPIHMIHHGIDTEAYKPLDRAECHALLGIPPNHKVLMFGAADIGRTGKGMDLLLSALQRLPVSVKENLTLLTFGHGSFDVLDSVGLFSIHLGYVNNDRLKAVAYSAADVFVMPSRGESFGLVVLESMACGTPSVAFKVGGLTDLVRPEETGLLAEPENVDELSAGITRLLEDDALRGCLSVKCRETAVREFAVGRCVQGHAELYKEMVKEH